jgi:hypothetical protein
MMTTSSQTSSYEVELMAGEQHRSAGSRNVTQQVGHGSDRERIETGERLIENEQIRVVDKCGDKLDALLITVRERVEPIFRTGRKTQSIEPRVDASTRFPDGSPRQSCQIHELVPNSHAQIQPALFGHVAEPRPLFPPNRRTSPPHHASIQLDEPKHSPHRRRLPGAIRANEAGQPSRANRERAPVEGGHCTKPLRRAFELEHPYPLTLTMTDQAADS